MDIRVEADVECADGPCGRRTQVIIDPKTERVTYLVVKEKAAPHTQRLVPVDQVVETTPTLIRLRCTSEALAKRDPFTETEYVPTGATYLPGEYAMWPIPEAFVVPVEHAHMTEGELALSQGARMEATDGQVGQVDELVVDPANGQITHLVLREGHRWGKKDVMIPVSQIERIEQGVVYLKLNKHSLAALPATPVHRGTWSAWLRRF